MAPTQHSPHHRFLKPQDRRAGSTQEHRQPSTRPQETPTQPPANSTQHAPSPSQFASTPRFAFAKSKRPLNPRPPSPPKLQVIQALRSTQRAEDVEETAEPEDEHSFDNDNNQIIPTTETNLPFSPKRRRIDPGDRPTFSPPTQATPFTTPPKHPPRFAPSSTQAPQNPTPNPARPTFILSSNTQAAASTVPSEPIPEAFSPHRRGPKFLPGGTASTVQQWILEAGHVAAQTRRTIPRGMDIFAAKVKVLEVRGSGPFVVRGVGDEGLMVRFVLAGKWAEGVEVGRVVGVKEPVWEVEDGEGGHMMVGVDWKVLPQ